MHVTVWWHCILRLHCDYRLVCGGGYNAPHLHACHSVMILYTASPWLQASVHVVEDIGSLHMLHTFMRVTVWWYCIQLHRDYRLVCAWWRIYRKSSHAPHLHACHSVMILYTASPWLQASVCMVEDIGSLHMLHTFMRVTVWWYCIQLHRDYRLVCAWWRIYRKSSHAPHLHACHSVMILYTASPWLQASVHVVEDI